MMKMNIDKSTVKNCDEMCECEGITTVCVIVFFFIIWSYVFFCSASFLDINSHVQERASRKKEVFVVRLMFTLY